MTITMLRHPWRPRRATDFFLVLALIGTALGMAGCGHTVDHKISDRISAALPGLLGPADAYDVTTSTDALIVLSGKIRSVDVHGRGVRLSPVLTMDNLTIDAHDIVVDPRTHRLSRFGRVNYTATLGQENLSRYLALTAARPGRPKDFSISLGDRDLMAACKIAYLGVTVPVTLRGTLQTEATDPSCLDFVPSQGALGIVPIPEALIRVVVDRINPIVDFSRFRAPLTVSDVQVRDHQVSIAGTAKITPELLASIHQ